MLFNSYFFILLFLPTVLFLFFYSAKYNRKAALLILLLASLIFYGWCNYYYILLLISSIIVNFTISKSIRNSNHSITKKQFLWLGIIFNLALLFYFKYTNFFIKNINLSLQSHLSLLNTVLPVGVSFFTLTQIAFLVDTYRGFAQQYRFFNYALFVSYFPHLIAGPIIYHKEIMPQFEQKNMFKFHYQNVVLGLTLFAIGLFKKTVLADYLSVFVGPVFDLHSPYIPTLDAWTASLAYTLELYFDFSGYSDMAIGLSLLINIKLPINFYSPYKASNIIVFWRRWNMTLSRFLRDYVYIPLGGNRDGAIKRYLNLMITLLLGGLWHGASWNFVLWGFINGIYLCVNHGWISLKKLLGIHSVNGFISQTLSRIVTFLAVVIAWVFFRSPDMSNTYQILKGLFFQNLNWPETYKGVTSFQSTSLIFISLIIVWLLPNSYQLLKKYKPALLFYVDTVLDSKIRWRPTLAWNCFIAFLLIVGILNIQISNLFLYFRF